MNVENKRSPIHGLGVFAKERIQAGHWQYMYGMLVPTSSSFGFDNEDGTWWEPFPPFRYTNHANDPNCEVSCDEEDSTVYIEALRDIEPGEELTIDYGHDPSDNN
jgi:SET domain-containing protein